MLFKKPRIGIALAGGGAKGLAHIGFLETLKENGIPIDIISGTSIGAVIGAAYALEPDIEKLKETLRILIESDVFRDLKLDKFKSVEEDHWFDRIRNKLKMSLTFAEAATRPSLVPEIQVVKLFNELFGEKTFKDTKLPFAAVALDLVSGEDVLFREGLIRDAVRASTAIPGIFPTVSIDGKLLVDGGVTANAPITAARKLGADVIISAIFGYEPSPPGKLESSMSVILRGDELAKLKLFRMLIEKADYVVEIDTGNTHWTDFGMYEECIEKGKEAAITHLDKLKRISSGGSFRRWFVSRKAT
ncbi:MAG: patatin-like phospholipase family protein [Candidatus Aegiribacteria sp.]|nr:patatin-like phospholipase family protein [Candidatus Aegiribacteria sp.]